MPVQDLLDQILVEHEALQAKYNELVVECVSRHECFEKLESTDTLSVTSHRRQFLSEPFHGTEAPMTTRASIKTEGEQPAGKLERSESKKSRRSVFQHFLQVRTISKRFDAEEGTLRYRTVQILRSPWFELLTALTVISNAAIMWINTDRLAKDEEELGGNGTLDLVFLVIYSIEFLARLFGNGVTVFYNRWNILDCVIIFLDVLNLVMRAIADSSGMNVKVFRLLRLFRLARVVGLLRHSTELQLLIHGFLGAMRALFFAMLLLWLVILIWSFIFVEFIGPIVDDMVADGHFEGCTQCSKAYSSIAFTHLTLLQTIVAGDSWGKLAYPIIEEYPLTLPIFIGSLMTIHLGVMNLIFTVIVDAAHKARASDEARMAEDKAREFNTFKNKFIEMCKVIDEDGSGDLTLTEMTQAMRNNKQFADMMATLDVTEDDMATVFKFLDEDKSGSVSYHEFVNNLYRLQKHDMRTTLFFIKGHVSDIRDNLKDDIRRMLTKLTNEFHQFAFGSSSPAPPGKLPPPRGESTKAVESIESEGWRYSVAAEPEPHVSADDTSLAQPEGEEADRVSQQETESPDPYGDAWSSKPQVVEDVDEIEKPRKKKKKKKDHVKDDSAAFLLEDAVTNHESEYQEVNLSQEDA